MVLPFTRSRWISTMPSRVRRSEKIRRRSRRRVCRIVYTRRRQDVRLFLCARIKRVGRERNRRYTFNKLLPSRHDDDVAIKSAWRYSNDGETVAPDAKPRTGPANAVNSVIRPSPMTRYTRKRRFRTRKNYVQIILCLNMVKCNTIITCCILA